MPLDQTAVRLDHRHRERLSSAQIHGGRGPEPTIPRVRSAGQLHHLPDMGVRVPYIPIIGVVSLPAAPSPSSSNGGVHLSTMR